MKKYTQEEFRSIPFIDGFKHCPPGDYSEIPNFGDFCCFEGDCIFSKWSNFGVKCRFPENLNFGIGCIFGRGCLFRHGCNFAGWNSFSDGCAFGWGCNFEGKKFTQCGTNYFIRINNIGLPEDGCYLFNADDGIYIRCGCFFGTGAEFIEEVNKNHTGTKHAKTYALAIEMAAVQFEREK